MGVSKRNPAPAPQTGRVIWVMLPGAKPVEAAKASRKQLEEATSFCFDGDQVWRPMDAQVLTVEGARK